MLFNSNYESPNFKDCSEVRSADPPMNPMKKENIIQCRLRNVRSMELSNLGDKGSNSILFFKWIYDSYIFSYCNSNIDNYMGSNREKKPWTYQQKQYKKWDKEIKSDYHKVGRAITK